MGKMSFGTSPIVEKVEIIEKPMFTVQETPIVVEKPSFSVKIMKEVIEKPHFEVHDSPVHVSKPFFITTELREVVKKPIYQVEEELHVIKKPLFKQLSDNRLAATAFGISLFNAILHIIELLMGK